MQRAEEVMDQMEKKVEKGLRKGKTVKERSVSVVDCAVTEVLPF